MTKSMIRVHLRLPPFGELESRVRFGVTCLLVAGLHWSQVGLEGEGGVWVLRGL